MSYNVHEITTVHEFLDLWPFLLTGLQETKKVFEGRCGVPEERFFKTLLHIISGPRSQGAVLIMESFKGNKAGYAVVMNNTKPLEEEERSLLIFFAYFKGNFGINSMEGLREVEKWGLSKGYNKLCACSARINGAAMRLFEKKFNFKRDKISFVKDLVT